MVMSKTMELLSKYGACVECGNKLVGGKEGRLVVKDKLFHRACKCGWNITINEEGRVE